MRAACAERGGGARSEARTRGVTVRGRFLEVVTVPLDMAPHEVSPPRARAYGGPLGRAALLLARGAVSAAFWRTPPSPPNPRAKASRRCRAC